MLALGKRNLQKIVHLGSQVSSCAILAVSPKFDISASGWASVVRGEGAKFMPKAESRCFLRLIDVVPIPPYNVKKSTVWRIPLDFKSTCNLPKTSFSMKANLPQNEPKLLEHWEHLRLYERIRQARKGAAVYVLHDGPPYANGPIHLGHALNKCLKDFVVKSKSMAGFDAPYIPGWDCHGLPIEIKVDQKLGGKKLQMKPVDVRLECRKYAQKYLDLQREQFKRIGVLGRFDKPYSTMTAEYESVVLQTFYKFFEEDFVYKGLRPVYWCMHDRTALAEAEVEYETHTSPTVWVRYRLQSDPRTIEIPRDSDTKAERVRRILLDSGVTKTQASSIANLAENLGPNSLDTVELVMAFEESGIQIPEQAAEKIRAVLAEKKAGNP